MNGPQALTEFERSLISVRGVAANEAAWLTYRAEELPEDMAEDVLVKMHQGYSAGYDAAMKATRETLVKVQNVALAHARMATD